MIALGTSWQALRLLALVALGVSLVACSSFPMVQPAPGPTVPAAVATVPPAPPVAATAALPPPILDDKGHRTTLTALPPR